MDRARRTSARYERAEAVAGGFNHLVQLRENQTSLRLPPPQLPLTGSESTFGSFRVASLMGSVTVCPVDGACPSSLSSQR